MKKIKVIAIISLGLLVFQFLYGIYTNRIQRQILVEDIANYLDYFDDNKFDDDELEAHILGASEELKEIYSYCSIVDKYTGKFENNSYNVFAVISSDLKEILYDHDISSEEKERFDVLIVALNELESQLYYNDKINYNLSIKNLQLGFNELEILWDMSN